jgi:hypothetical protein
LIGIALGALVGHSAGVFEEFYFPESRDDAFFSVVIDHMLTGTAQGLGCGLVTGLGLLFIGWLGRAWLRRRGERTAS